MNDQPATSFAGPQGHWVGKEVVPSEMSDELVQSLKNLESHADAVMKIPPSEQFMGNFQAVVSVAILETKRAIEAMIQQREKGK